MDKIVLACVVFLFAFMPAANPDLLIRHSRQGDLDEVLSLLRQGVDPNIPNAEGLLPMPQAAFQGHVDVVEALLRKGADPASPIIKTQTARSSLPCWNDPRSTAY